MLLVGMRVYDVYMVCSLAISSSLTPSFPRQEH